MGQIALMIALGRFRHWVPILVGLLALAVYLPTLAPGLTWAHNGADGGDLMAASFAGGAAHPPGYPLYTLVGRVVAALPFGSIPYRYNLFSALAAAGAAALVAWAIEECGPAPALAAGLSLAFAPLVWSQAVISEVYALTALLAALIVGLGIRAMPRPLMLGVAFGLGLTHHLTLALLMPLAWAALARWAKEQDARRVVVRAVMGILIGLLPLAYLPLTGRALAGWGDASTLAGFWWLVSAQLYRGYAFSLPIASVLPRITETARVLPGSFTWLGVAAGLWGLAILWERDRWRGTASAASALALAVFAIGYNSADSEVYLIPALAAFAVWIGLGWGEISRRGALVCVRIVERQERWGRVGLSAGFVLLMLLPPILTLARGWSVQDVHANRAARDFVDGVLAEAPPRAIIVTSEDRHTFALWAETFAGSGRRPDLAIVDQDLLGFDWYRARLRRGFPDLVVPDTEVGGASQLARLNPGRPVCRPTESPPPWLSCGEK